LIREELSEIFRKELKDPCIGFVTLTGVRMTRDLRTARVFISVMGSSDARESAREALSRATPFLRRALGKRLRLRHTPELLFVYDNTMEQGSRLDALLDSLKP
jgi:ribosome-binding factor A